MNTAPRFTDGAICAMPTLRLSHCSRRPRYAYKLRGEIVLQVCAQHYHSRGHAHLLRPRAWEIDEIIDLASGVKIR